MSKYERTTFLTSGVVLVDFVSGALANSREFGLALAETLGIRSCDFIVEATDSSDGLLVLIENNQCKLDTLQTP